MTWIVEGKGARLELAAPGVALLIDGEGRKQRVGLGGLRLILIRGEVSLSTRLLRAAHQGDVGVLLIPARGRDAACDLFPALAHRARLRLAQFRCRIEPERRLRLARALITRKIEAQAYWLRAHGLEVPMERFITGLAAVPDHDTVMGLEGAAAARYFQHWGALWEEPWHFNGRNRRPPRDPINALLSLGYTLAGHYVGRAARQRGLDDAVGYLHTEAANRPALILDLLEPVRPWVDQWIWSIAADGWLNPEHFTTNDGEGCRLNKEGRGIFFREWFSAEETWLRTPTRQALAVVVEALRRAMREE